MMSHLGDRPSHPVVGTPDHLTPLYAGAIFAIVNHKDTGGCLEEPRKAKKD